MTSITVPVSIEAATERLTALDALLTVRGWERAAIVWAFTYDAPRGRPRSNVENSTFTVAGFAAKKIRGLAARDTVIFYRSEWKAAMERGEAADVKPGEKVALPTSDFPSRKGNEGSRTSADPERAVQQVIEKHGADVVAKTVIKAVPKEVGKAVASDHDASVAVSRERLERTRSHEDRRRLTRTNAERSRRMDDAVDDATTAMENTGLMHHQATLDVLTARRWLRRAVGQFERNPSMDEEQREETEAALAECEHLIMLLRGDTGSWTQGDLEFLEAIGVEE
jgi:hypothetical protein